MDFISQLKVDGPLIINGKDKEELVWSGKRIKCELNVLNKAEGSAILSQGQNMVLAALYGPYELKHIWLQEDQSFQVNYHTKTTVPGSNFRPMEDLLKTACESVFVSKSFGRHQTSLQVQELQDAGSILSCAINATCLAMISSGMPMKYLVAAACCSMDKDGEFTIDPDDDTIKKSKLVMTVAFDNIDYNILMINSEGSSTSEQHNKAINICRTAAMEMIEYFSYIVKKYSNALL